MSPSIESFDEVKYKALMDGLECSEIFKSVINGEFRIDSEYYKKIYLCDDLFIHKFSTLPIGQIATVSDGQHGYHEEDSSSPIHMLTAKNAKDWFANLINAIHVAKWVDDNNKRSSLSVDDIILSTRGTVGKCALVKSDVLPANLDQDVARISFTDTRIFPGFALCFLNSKFGQNWMIRNQTGMVQQGLSLDKVRQMPIPHMTHNLQERISEIVEKAFAKKKASESQYCKASEILSNIVKSNYSQTVAISVKDLSQSFCLSGRLDAEYYQPKYEYFTKTLNTKESIFSLCNIYDENCLPENNIEYDYIELANVGVSGEISGVETKLGVELPSRARRRVKSGQVIVSSIEGSLQSCALITDEYDGAFCSTGFYVLDSDCINSETLLVLFKSEPIQALMKQRCAGTILTAISKDEFLSMPLPMIGVDVQKEIATKVQESFTLRKRSKQLLEYAKQTVEMAIEQGEDVALKWLKDRVN